MSKHIVRIDIEDTVHIAQGLLICPQLCAYESSVVKSKCIAGLILEHAVKVIHRRLILLLLIIHYGPVEISECIGRI